MAITNCAPSSAARSRTPPEAERVGESTLVGERPVRAGLARAERDRLESTLLDTATERDDFFEPLTR